MLRGLAVTGGVITSAGIVLAGTFAVLGVLPLVFLTEIGFVVAFGVLLDTFIVRSVLVPALTFQLGPRIWKPSSLARSRPALIAGAAALRGVLELAQLGSSSSSSAASMFSSRCADELVPGIGSITGERASSHARATWPASRRGCAAISATSPPASASCPGGERRPTERTRARRARRRRARPSTCDR